LRLECTVLQQTK